MNDDEALAQLRRMEPDLASLAAHVDDGEVFDCGPFRALVSRSTDWANLAQPIAAPDDAGAVIAAVEEICRRFAERGRSPRFLFREPFFPNLAAMLERAPLTLSGREPLMVCAPGGLRPITGPDIAVRLLHRTDPDADLIAFQSIRSEAFGEGPWQPTDEALAAFRHGLDRDGRLGAALATLDGRAAGTGFAARHGDGCEIMQVATLPDLRRRGVAAMMTSFLAHAALEDGARLLWLTAATPVARALYERIGFRYVGDELTYVPAGEGRQQSA